MEPPNHLFGKENDLPNLHEDMFHVNLPGCNPILHLSHPSEEVFFEKDGRTFQGTQENAHFTATQIDSDTKATQPDVGKQNVNSYKTILGCPWKLVTS